MRDWDGEYQLAMNNDITERDASKSIYETSLGRAYCAESFAMLKSRAMSGVRGKVQLVFTSPPFPLNTKKKYGNLNGEAYLDWLASYAIVLRNLVSDNGSIVLEIGNAWQPGRPTMSTLPLRALLRFLEAANLNLCQEFVWYNPARLPSPVQWVNVERCRVKDAFTRIWWMSPSDRPKADNRNVLREYSAAMQKLIKGGRYNAGRRPSEHYVGKSSFRTDNKGAIPPNVINGDAAESLGNLLKGTNTHNMDQYQLFCRQNNIQSHPARMPPELVEFFIKFLTDPHDIVVDPFAGSNTTGAQAERLGRRWRSIEAQWDYAAASISRFRPESMIATCPQLRIQKVA